MVISQSILVFINAGLISTEDGFYYCRTRDQSAARLSKWLKDFKSIGISSNESAILVGIIGEITNNSFDHNLGMWNEPSGCVVFIKKEVDILLVLIADRGQGIISSLSPILEEHLSSAATIKKAFEERISGRAPEKRGNGLKFVLSQIQQTGNSLFCFSQQATYSIGAPKIKIDPNNFPKDYGTFISIEWRIK
jgi:hypothetical protein